MRHMKLQKKALTMIAALSLSIGAAAACSSRADISKAPIGSDVQLTEQSGAVVEGRLTARDETTVTVKGDRATRRVERGEIADVQIVTPGHPATLPAVAKFREYVVPDGTVLALSLVTATSSDTSNVGDAVEATLSDAVSIADEIVLPEGSVVRGSVTVAEPAGKVKGRASLALHFDEMTVSGERYKISAGIAVEAPSTKKKDAAMIGIPAAAGAIIGAIVGGGQGAAAGAAIGGGGGTAAVLLTEGKPVEFGRGMAMRVKLANDVKIRVPVR